MPPQSSPPPLPPLTCLDVPPHEDWAGQENAAGSRVVFERAPTPRRRSSQALALVLRGDMFRGPLEFGVRCAKSIQDAIVTPAWRSATAVDSFLSVYAGLDSYAWQHYAQPINGSIALVSVVNRSTQLSGIVTAIEGWRSYLGRHEDAQYTAALLLRYDLHWKTDVTAYLRGARFLGEQLQEVRPLPLCASSLPRQV